PIAPGFPGLALPKFVPPLPAIVPPVRVTPPGCVPVVVFQFGWVPAVPVVPGRPVFVPLTVGVPGSPCVGCLVPPSGFLSVSRHPTPPERKSTPTPTPAPRRKRPRFPCALFPPPRPRRPQPAGPPARVRAAPREFVPSGQPP